MLEKKVSTCLIALLLLGMIMAFPTSVKANPTDVSVINATLGSTDYGTTLFNFSGENPPPTDTGYPLGYMLANITVTGVSDMGGWQLNLTWQAALLEIATVDDIYRTSDMVFGLTGIEVSKQVKDGTVFWGCSNGVGKPMFEGDGVLCQIKFNITKVPLEGEKLSCDLVLDQVSAFPTEIYDHLGLTLTYTPQDGDYEYSWPLPPPPPSKGAEFFVRPPKIINSSILPPQTIQVNVTVKNVTDMYHYGFSLGYDPDILIGMGLAFFDVLGETHYIPEFSIDNTAGIIKVNVTYYSPAVPITTLSEVPLVNIILRVKGTGATPLHLYNTTIADSLGRPIPHEAHDGFFTNLVRDLAITNVAPRKPWVYHGNFLKINVTVLNNGEIIETSVSVKTYFDSYLIDTIIIPSLNPSEEITITFIWNTTDVTPCQNYTLSSEVVSVPYELDLENNKFTYGDVKVRLMCDVNGDNKVDTGDLVAIVNAIPSMPSYPNWNPCADVNDDGIIDISDLVITVLIIPTSCS
jgi:hypothetical protein